MCTMSSFSPSLKQFRKLWPLFFYFIKTHSHFGFLPLTVQRGQQGAQGLTGREEETDLRRVRVVWSIHRRTDRRRECRLVLPCKQQVLQGTYVVDVLCQVKRVRR